MSRRVARRGATRGARAARRVDGRGLTPRAPRPLITVMTDSRYADRRARFLASMGQGVAVFASTPVAIRNNDVEHEFRQDSDLYYLTGFDEPETVLVLAPQHAEHRVVLF